MKFYSTRNKNLEETLSYSILNGLAPDGGLFMPEKFLSLDLSQCRTFAEIAFEASSKFVDGDIDDEELKNICNEAFNFPIPIVEIAKNTFVMELFHGPTMAFKDFGARFMARMVSALKDDPAQRTTVIVATSGDTGGAVASGFHGVRGIDVVLLYPKGKVSPLQEKQLTTWGDNITAIEVEGSFDDCQRMVKESFHDQTVKENLNLTAANSINIARLIPQMLYYLHAVKELGSKELIFSVPSGNFGNLTAGVFAKRLGMPLKKFIASTNINDAVPRYLESGAFEPKPSVKTISNAMDVGEASNFERLMDLYGNSLEDIQKDVTGYSFNDELTALRMKQLYEEKDYLIDPHGAVGLLGAEKYREEQSDSESPIVVLGTAHPAKFNEVVEDHLGFSPEIPHRLSVLTDKKKNSIPCSNDFKEFKEILLGKRR